MKRYAVVRVVSLVVLVVVFLSRMASPSLADQLFSLPTMTAATVGGNLEIESLTHAGVTYVVADGDLATGTTTRWYLDPNNGGAETQWVDGDPVQPGMPTVLNTSNPKVGDTGAKADNFTLLLGGGTNISSIDGIDFQQTIFPFLSNKFFLFERGGNDTGFWQSINADDTLGTPVNFANGDGIYGGGNTGVSVNGQNAFGVAFETDVPVKGVRITASGHDTISITTPGPDPLVLEVNTTNGQVAIANSGTSNPQPVDFQYYEIRSSNGSLLPGNGAWNSLDDQNVDAYGDYNVSGAVDAADYTTWRDNEGAAEGTLPNDGDGGVIGPDQYDTWVANFGTAAGQPGFGWDESGGVDTNELIELRLTGVSNLMPGESLGLGAAYNTATPDLNLTFTYAGPSGNLVNGDVRYVTSAQAAAQSVPEPASLMLCGLLLLPLGIRRFRFAALGLLLCAPFVLPSDGQAAEVHRYTFNDGTANDSIGGAHGTLINPEGLNRYTVGQLNLFGNNGFQSGQDYSLPGTQGAYVNLPNNLISDASGGIPDTIPGNAIGALSLEVWYTVDTNRSSARVWQFGNNDGLIEDSPTASGGGDLESDISLEPDSGGGTHALRVQTRFDQLREILDLPAGPSPVREQQHVVTTFDHDDLSAGSNGTVKVYIGGALEMTGPIAFKMDENTSNTGLYLDTFEPYGDINNWLGRSIFSNNPLFDGAINEFRVYDTPLTAAEVTASNLAGPDLTGTPLAPDVVGRSQYRCGGTHEFRVRDDRADAIFDQLGLRRVGPDRVDLHRRWKCELDGKRRYQYSVGRIGNGRRECRQHRLGALPWGLVTRT